jgi:hypothetical protein
MNDAATYEPAEPPVTRPKEQAEKLSGWKIMPSSPPVRAVVFPFSAFVREPAEGMAVPIFSTTWIK